jgi:hypothetical protein
VLDIIEGVGGIDAEANEDDVSFGVGEGTEAFVVFLTGGIPEGELYRLAIYSAVGDIVLEDGWDVALWFVSSMRRSVTCGHVQLESIRE